MSETVSIRRRTDSDADRWNNTIHGYSDPEQLAGSWVFDPGGSTVTRDPSRYEVSSAPILYVRGVEPTIASVDHIIVRGVEYTVDGEPAMFRRDGSFIGGIIKLSVVSEEA